MIKRADSENMASFVASIYDNRDGQVRRCFTLNEHGDLYFLLHNFGVQIIPFKSKNVLKYLSEGKKIYLITYTKPLTQRCKL